jgi:hypothetical protein
VWTARDNLGLMARSRPPCWLCGRRTRTPRTHLKGHVSAALTFLRLADDEGARSAAFRWLSIASQILAGAEKTPN